MSNSPELDAPFATAVGHGFWNMEGAAEVAAEEAFAVGNEGLPKVVDKGVLVEDVVLFKVFVGEFECAD
jgi:hypothetical protein